MLLWQMLRQIQRKVQPQTSRYRGNNISRTYPEHKTSVIGEYSATDLTADTEAYFTTNTMEDATADSATNAMADTEPDVTADSEEDSTTDAADRPAANSNADAMGDVSIGAAADPDPDPEPEQEDCVICRVPLSEPAVARPCNHTFDFGCIHRWVLDGYSSCPVCRATMEDLRYGPELGLKLQVPEPLIPG